MPSGIIFIISSARRAVKEKLCTAGSCKMMRYRKAEGKPKKSRREAPSALPRMHAVHLPQKPSGAGQLVNGFDKKVIRVGHGEMVAIRMVGGGAV